MNDLPPNSLPKRIVYVDDSPRDRQIACAALEDTGESGNIFIACSAGDELIARLKELQPDLILLDLLMPGMNGPDTIDALRKSSAHNFAPVIFVTEQKKIAMIEDYKALGVLGVIYKPFDPDGLREQVHMLWQNRHTADA